MEVMSYNKNSVKCMLEPEATRRFRMPLDGKRVKELRESRNMTQGELGDNLGNALIELAQMKQEEPLTPDQKEMLYEEGKVSQQQINLWEKEKSDPKGQSISLLAIALGCTTDYLLGLVDKPYERLELSQLRPDQRKLLELYEHSAIPKSIRRMLGDPTFALPTTTETFPEPRIDETQTPGDEEESNRKVS